jgi:hypothetical protein
MVARIRLAAALGAMVAAVVLVMQSTPPASDGRGVVALRSTDMPLNPPSSPVVNITDPTPFDPCADIPLDVVAGLGLAFTPPEPENNLRCKYDAGNYQMAVEAIVWRTFEESLPPDAVELDINGHRAAQYWIMKPTDWNNRWWITCMITFRASYGVIQQSLFYSPVYSPNGPDCIQENLMRAQQLSPHYTF